MVTNSTTCTFYTNLVVNGSFTESSGTRLQDNINELDSQTCCDVFESINPKIYIRKGTQKNRFYCTRCRNSHGWLRYNRFNIKGEINEDDDTEYLSLSYGKMNVILWGVVKNLKKEISDLRKEIDALKAN